VIPEAEALSMGDFEAKVLGLVSRPDYKPLTLKAMSRRLTVGVEQYADFRATVKALVRAGKLDVAKDRTLRRADVKGAILGTYRRSSKGFGFVRP
jgi:ribonuclease R